MNRKLPPDDRTWTTDREAGRREGERRKADAFAKLDAHRQRTIRCGQRALLSKLLANGTATADDVRAVVELPPGTKPYCFGSVPNALARSGIIRRVGYQPSARPDTHARPISVWQLADRDKAVQWLEAHPDFPEPPPRNESSTAAATTMLDVEVTPQ